MKNVAIIILLVMLAVLIGTMPFTARENRTLRDALEARMRLSNAAGSVNYIDNEVKVGQVWRRNFDGSVRKILEAGTNHVVFEYSAGNHKVPTAQTITGFLDDHTLIKTIRLEDTTLSDPVILKEELIIEPNEPPQWGKGDLPDEFKSVFGNNNSARLDYVQNQVLDRHSKIIAELAKHVIDLEGGDPNE